MTVDWEGLELQLRALPGTVAAGFTVTDHMVTVHLLLGPDADEPDLRRSVADLTASVIDRPVVIEAGLVDEPSGEPLPPDPRRRIGLLGVWVEGIKGSVKVQLTYAERIADGEASGFGATAGAEATLAALAALGSNEGFSVQTARGALSDPVGHVVEVALNDTGDMRRYGIAAAETIEVAAARATLHALNRHLASHPPLAPGQQRARADEDIQPVATPATTVLSKALHPLGARWRVGIVRNGQRLRQWLDSYPSLVQARSRVSSWYARSFRSGLFARAEIEPATKGL